MSARWLGLFAPFVAGCGVPNVVFVTDAAVATIDAGNTMETPDTAGDAAQIDAGAVPDALNTSDATEDGMPADASSPGVDAADAGQDGPGYCTPTQPNPPDGGACCSGGLICTGSCAGGNRCSECAAQCHSTGVCCVMGNKIISCLGC